MRSENEPEAPGFTTGRETGCGPSRPWSPGGWNSIRLMRTTTANIETVLFPNMLSSFGFEGAAAETQEAAAEDRIIKDLQNAGGDEKRQTGLFALASLKALSIE
jgi:hypothetical protein